MARQRDEFGGAARETFDQHVHAAVWHLGHLANGADGADGLQFIGLCSSVSTVCSVKHQSIASQRAIDRLDRTLAGDRQRLNRQGYSTTVSAGRARAFTRIGARYQSPWSGGYQWM